MAIRLGGPIVEKYEHPDQWVENVKRAGYSAAYCPVQPGTDSSTIQAYADAAKAANIVIAEVGAWSNPLSPDDDARHAALKKNQEALALADEIGALCCVNIAGSRGDLWDGHHADNFTDDTFDLIVETVRGIIDAVRPTRTFYTLETMPWAYPHTVDSYLALIEAIDRPQFAVHLDPVNMVTSPLVYYQNAELFRECFSKLWQHIKSCHAKDIILGDKLTVHLDEVRPGLGILDYRVFLTEANRLNRDVPIMLEHLPAEEYPPAADYVRNVARENGVPII